MLPITSAEAGSGVRRNGSTAAGWLPVNGTETDEARQLGHRAVEVAVGVLDRADEVAEQLEADRAVDGAPRQQRADPDGVVQRRVLTPEDGDGVPADQPGIPLAGRRGQPPRAGGVAENRAEQCADPRRGRHGIPWRLVAGYRGAVE